MRCRFRFCNVCRRLRVMGFIHRASKEAFTMVIKMWKQEFSLSGFGLKYDTPEEFTRCHWQKAERVLPLWIVYRSVMALYFVATFLYTVLPLSREVPEEMSVKYLIFLTHWTYIVEMIVFVLSFIIVVIKAVSESKSKVPPVPMEKMPWYYMVYWALYTTLIPSSLTVSIIFWISVYDPKLFPVNALNLFEHAFNSIFSLLDFALVGHPFKFLHFYIPLTYASIYTFFTICYFFAGGTGVKGMTPIYKILDWRYPWKAILTCFICLIFLLVLHTLFSFLSMLKFWMKSKKRQEQNK